MHAAAPDSQAQAPTAGTTCGPTLLALETSCDETSASIIRNGRILSNIVASQTTLHAPYGGVVPELAAREHLRNLQPVLDETLRQAGVHTHQLDAVAATRGPGLPLALLTGFRAAASIAFALNRPFYGIHHHEAHLLSPWIEAGPDGIRVREPDPHVALIVSGGHSLLVHAPGTAPHRVLGSTLDDAAGECFDKVAKLLGLGYPGGPEIDRLAATGNPAAFALPRPMLHSADDDFSFSGLKTAARYHLRDHPATRESSQPLADFCASFQAAIIEVLVTKTVRAARRLQVRVVTVSGGVACNRSLRTNLTRHCAEAGLTARLTAPAFCTDNAAMVAALAERQLRQRIPPTPIDADVLPGWTLEQRAGQAIDIQTGA